MAFFSIRYSGKMYDHILLVVVSLPLYSVANYSGWQWQSDLCIHMGCNPHANDMVAHKTCRMGNSKCGGSFFLVLCCCVVDIWRKIMEKRIQHTNTDQTKILVFPIRKPDSLANETVS